MSKNIDKNPLDLMHQTPNGGWAVRTGKHNEFNKIPCRHSTNKKNKTDTYYYAGGIKLRIGWKGSEFDLV